MRRVVSLLIAAVLTTTLVAAAGSPAGAAPKGSPKATLKVDSDSIEAGGGATFDFSLKRAPRGTRSNLEVKTAGQTWQSVAKLTKDIVITAPPVSVGEYRYRAVARTAKGRVLATSKTITVRAYGSLPFTQLGFLQAATPGIVTIAGSPFAYARRNIVADLGYIRRSSCVGATVSVGSPEGAFDLQIGTGARQRLAGDQLHTLSAFLPPGGDLSFNVLTQTGVNVYLNGTAYCYTADGRA